MNKISRTFRSNQLREFAIAQQNSLSYSKQTNRDLFYLLMHITENYGSLPVVYNFVQHKLGALRETYQNPYHQAVYTSHGIEDLLNSVQKPEQTKTTELPLATYLFQYAPIAFTELTWLASLSQAATVQTPVNCELMVLYLRLTRGGMGLATNRLAYTTYLLSCNVELPEVYSLAFSQHKTIVDEVFDLAVMQLALSQFPQTFFPEIMGFTLAYCHLCGGLEQVCSLSDCLGAPHYITERYLRNKQEQVCITKLVKNYITEQTEQVETVWQRVKTGFLLYQTLRQNAVVTIQAQQQKAKNPRQAMMELLNRLMPHAIGHHGKVQLGGIGLDDWFKAIPFNENKFFSTLLDSRYVDCQHLENSQLLRLFTFNGPMFGVLSETDMNIVKDWLVFETGGKPSGRILCTSQAKKNITDKQHTNDKSAFSEKFGDNKTVEPPLSPLGRRMLFHYLVNNETYPEVLPIAKKRVEHVLTLTRQLSRVPVPDFSLKAFNRFITQLYQQETARYQPLNGKPQLSKQAYLWGIEQFAPAILTDGCWLQTVYRLNFSSHHEIGNLLSKIYEDEIGNGLLVQNHPYIYQQLLESLKISLPSIQDLAFVQHKGFIESAFDIPNYLMAISKFPGTFLPELLGLNMAIEINGLGRIYLRLSEELRYWGINSAIVDIHTSIDNLATGHAALAIKTIELYLDKMFADYDKKVMNEHWRRIYTGFCSLAWASKRFKLALVGQYWWRNIICNPFNQVVLHGNQ